MSESVICYMTVWFPFVLFLFIFYSTSQFSKNIVIFNEVLVRKVMKKLIIISMFPRWFWESIHCPYLITQVVLWRFYQLENLFGWRYANTGIHNLDLVDVGMWVISGFIDTVTDSYASHSNGGYETYVMELRHSLFHSPNAPSRGRCVTCTSCLLRLFELEDNSI